MKNRDQLRLEKQRECDEKIEKIYREIPLLGQIDRTIGEKNVSMIRVGILRKNKAEQDKLQKEIEELMQKRHALLMEHGMDESIYEPDWDCPKCQDRGYLKPGELCSCLLRERMDDLFNNSGMSEAMKQYTFGNFSADYYPDREGMQDKVAWCKEFAVKIAEGTNRDNLFLTGQVGRGKTHLSAAIANEVLKSGKTVLYKRAIDLFDLIRRYKFEEDPEQGRKLLNQIKTCDLLVIDDLGAERTTDFVTEQLISILDDRNYNNKAWIISSNLSLSEVGKTYTDRTSDRILDRAKIFKLERGESMRVTKAIHRK